MLKTHNTAVLVTPAAGFLPDLEADWIGVDAGWKIITDNGHECAMAVGDFDTGAAPENIEVIRHPVRKDETDTQLAMRLVETMGYQTVIIWGGLGKRLDHTLANLRMMAWEYPDCILMDEKTRARVLTSGIWPYKKEYRHVSFFALEPSVITLRGFEYPLDQAQIDQKTIFTVSNAVKEAAAWVEIEKGRVLSIETNWK